MSEPIHFAVVTPPGRGAVATLAVRGPRAVELVGRRFAAVAGRPLGDFPVGRVVFGRFRGRHGPPEELVVGLIAADEVEIHCHGGAASVENIAAALLVEGAQRETPHDWAWQVESDALAAEAALALAEAPTERTAGILLDQYRGALARAIDEIAAHCTRGDQRAAERRLSQLLARAEFGRHLTRPWRVVIAGRPNVGKSSLINALVGYERAIVFDQPGTTRDVLTASTAFDGWPVELADTAGLRAAEGPIEAEGVERAQRQIAQADAVLLVSDLTAPWTAAEDEVLRAVNRPIVVHNKCDLAPAPSDGRPEGVCVSALTRQGIQELESTISNRLIPEPPTAGAAVPFAERQVVLLREAESALAAGDVQAIERLRTRLRVGDARSNHSI